MVLSGGMAAKLVILLLRAVVTNEQVPVRVRKRGEEEGTTTWEPIIQTRCHTAERVITAALKAGRRAASVHLRRRPELLPPRRPLAASPLPGLLVLGPWSLRGAAMFSLPLRVDCALMPLWHFISEFKKKKCL